MIRITGHAGGRTMDITVEYDIEKLVEQIEKLGNNPSIVQRLIKACESLAAKIST